MERRRAWLIGGSVAGVALLGAVVGGVAIAATDDDTDEPAAAAAAIDGQEGSGGAIDRLAARIGVDPDDLGEGLHLQEGEDAEDIIDRLARNLGIDSDALLEGIRKTASELLDEAEAGGDVPGDVAGVLRGLIEDANLFEMDLDEILDSVAPLFGLEGFEFGQDGDGEVPAFGFGAFGLDDEIEGLAAFLGISADELKDELGTGQTLGEVAESHGKSREELRGYLGERADAKIAEIADEQGLSQEEADGLRETADGIIDAVIDGTIPGLSGEAFPGDLIPDEIEDALRGAAEEFFGGDLEGLFGEDGIFGGGMGEWFQERNEDGGQTY
jgi:hypothetical protein